MSVEEQIVEILGDDTAVAALVDDRIFPVAITRQTSYPALTYERLTGAYEYAIGGSGAWASVAVQLTAWADNYPDARELADACRAVFSPYVGDTVGEIEVAGVADGRDLWVSSPQVLWGCAVIVTVSFNQE